MGKQPQKLPLHWPLWGQDGSSAVQPIGAQFPLATGAYPADNFPLCPVKFALSSLLFIRQESLRGGAHEKTLKTSLHETLIYGGLGG